MYPQERNIWREVNLTQVVIRLAVCAGNDLTDYAAGNGYLPLKQGFIDMDVLNRVLGGYP